MKTIPNIIHETCDAIYKVLKPDHMKFPKNAEEWEAIAHDYLARWNYPICIGSLNGKHIVKPFPSNVEFFNRHDRHGCCLLSDHMRTLC